MVILNGVLHLAANRYGSQCTYTETNSHNNTPLAENVSVSGVVMSMCPEDCADSACLDSQMSASNQSMQGCELQTVVGAQKNSQDC